MAEKDIDKRMAARRARVEAARDKVTSSEPEEAKASMEASDEPITDYWKLPKSGQPTTLLNSAWTWTILIYLAILVIAVLSVAQDGSGLIDRQSNTVRIAIAVALIYPAWRIGSLVSRFMKKRKIGSGFSVSETFGSNGKAVEPDSVEARMAARKARVEKARESGKL